MKLYSLAILALVVPALALAAPQEQSKDVFARQHRNKNNVDDWFEQVEGWIRSVMQQWGRLGRGGQGPSAAPSVGPVRTFTEADTITATTTLCQRWYNCHESVYTTTINPRTFTETVVVHTTTAPCQNGNGNCVVITPSQSIQPATGTQLSTVYGTTTSRSCFWGYCGSPVTVTYTTTVTLTVTYTATLTASLTPITSPLSGGPILSVITGATLTGDDSSVTTDATSSGAATVGATLTGDDSSITTGTTIPSPSLVTSAALTGTTVSQSPESLVSSFTSSASAALSSLSASDSAVLSDLSSSQASFLSSLQSTGSLSDISSISSVLSSSASSIQSSLSSVNSAVTSSLSSQQSSLLSVLDPGSPGTNPSMTSSQASGILTSLPSGLLPSTTPINSILTSPSLGLTLTISVGTSTLVVAPSTVSSTKASTTSTTSRASSTTSATTLRTSTTTRSSTTTTTTSRTTTSAVQATQTIDVTGMTYINAMLIAHNVHRSNHSLPALVWDANLAAIAGQIASNCVYAHNVTAGGGGYGQNIGAGAIGNAAAGLVNNLMYNNEIIYYPLPYGNDNPDLSTFHLWGHYSQIVWTSTTSVGCVTQYCPQGLANTGTGVAPYFTVCNYGPPGNYVGEFSQVAAPKGGATVVIVGS